jgi:ubiquinone/menaquinone biosynthesis C-methylase UbiE
MLMRETKNVNRPEFDQFAENYSAGFDDPLKGVFGQSAQAFMAPKLHLLERAVRRLRPDFLTQPIKVLDFGCGAGDFLSGLARHWPNWALEGCDVSSGMLLEARKRLGHEYPDVRLWQAEEIEFPKSAYDLVTIVCVLHHVDPVSLGETLQTTIESLTSGGLLVIMEHNPVNPVTRWMVSRTEVDRNAHLVSARSLRNRLPLKEFTKTEIRNFLFFPPRLSVFAGVESALEWLPLGGQYAFFGVKA